MRINQEKFEELSQLDRIEFRQQEDRIREENSDHGIRLLWIAVLFVLGGIFMDLYSVVKIGEGITNLSSFMICALVFVILGIIFFFAGIISRFKEFAKLEEKFFEIKTRGKK